MLSIGDFSKLSRVPVKTLRYYDEIGLFKPLEVDRFTSYRHYSASQLIRLNRILVHQIITIIPKEAMKPGPQRASTPL